MAKLLPCPFCGGEAEFITQSNISNSYGVGFSYIIACSNCECTPIRSSEEIYMSFDKNGEIVVNKASKETRQEMINTWNTRIPKERSEGDGLC